MSIPGAEDLGVEAVPVDDTPITADAELDAAVASVMLATDGSVAADDAQDVPAPLGFTWSYDQDARRFVRQGQAPTRVAGLSALREWCNMALNVARGANVRIFSDEFGTDHPNEPLGELVSAELTADVQRKYTEALMVHDRIVDVGAFDIAIEIASEGGLVVHVRSMTVTTDIAGRLSLSNVQLILEN